MIQMIHGFMMGAVSSTGGHYIDKYADSMGKIGEISANAVLSGTVDELGGGKFANGAITGAFAIMFNDMMHQRSVTNQNDDDPLTAAVGIALTASATDGPLPIGEIVGAGVITAAAVYDMTQRVYVTYTLEGPNGQIYVGRTSGYGTPEQLVQKRYAAHHMKARGFGNPKVDKAIQGIQGRPAIRGREQQLIDFYGGVGNPKVANRIRGVSKINPGGRFFHTASNLFFGNIAPYTGY